MLLEATTTDHESLETRVARILGDTVVRGRTQAGGKICDVVRIEFRHHPPVVAKHATPAADLSLEANMLRHLRDVSDLPVPEVLHHDDDLLVLAAMPGEHVGTEASRHCAELVAGLHGITNASFGFGGLTLNGRVMLESPWSDRWIPFFREHRLRFAMRRAVDHEQLPEQYHDDLERIFDGLDDLLVEPSQPALLHGDLWNANVLAEGSRVTAFLDPSACYGDPELEIAYVDAFGAFGPVFLQRYQELRPLPMEFWLLRRHVYALYPLLMHVYYFGERFLPHLERTITTVRRQM
jgi:fructosamine-3-kinase